MFKCCSVVAVAAWFMVLTVGSVARGVDTPADDRFRLGPPAPQTGTSPPATTRSAASGGGETASLSPDDLDPPTVEAGLVEFFATRFSAHEPIYFVVGAEEPEAKFQFSLKYQLFVPSGPLAEKHEWLSDLFLAYSQTSFWDLGTSNSSPFFDSSYRPEVLYSAEAMDAEAWSHGVVSRFDFQMGVEHESNGKAGDDSRSLNVAYIRPIFTFGDDGGIHDSLARRGFFIAVAPRLLAYLTEMPDNPDIYHYRGYGDLKVVVGWRGDLQLAALARVGNDWNKGSLQLDLTYPLRALSGNNIDLYLDAQFFTGYGESLLEYDERDTTFRLGLALVR